jgi:hypothetical protein
MANHPTLKTCLRSALSAYREVRDAVWREAAGPAAVSFDEEELRRGCRLGRPGQRHIDEMWAQFIDRDEELRRAIGVPAGYMDHSLRLERGYIRMIAAASSAARGVLGGIRLIRAALYGVTGVIQQRVTVLRRQGGASAASRWLEVLWGDVHTLEELPHKQAQKTREKARKEAALADKLRKAGQTEEDRQDIERLLAFARRGGGRP